MGDYTTTISHHLNEIQDCLNHLDKNLEDAFNMINKEFNIAIHLRYPKTRKQQNCVQLNKILTGGTLSYRGLNLALKRFEHTTKFQINTSFQKIEELKNENPHTELLSLKSLKQMFDRLTNLQEKTEKTIFMFRLAKKKILKWPAYTNEVESSSNDYAYCHKMIKDTFHEQFVRLRQLNGDFLYFRAKLVDLTMRPKNKRSRSKQYSRKSVAVPKLSNLTPNKTNSRQTRKFKPDLSTIMEEEEESIQPETEEFHKKSVPSLRISPVGSRSRSKKIYHSTSHELLPKLRLNDPRTVRSQ
jgi:hypothetical protein